MTDEAPVARLGLPRSMRVQTKREFTLIHNQGQRLVRGALILNWMILPEGAKSRLGVVTSRKLGKANIRVRARRLMKEAFRLHQHELRNPVDLILVARASIVGKKLASVERDYLSLLKSARLVKQAG